MTRVVAREASDVPAHAKAAVAGKLLFAVERRHAGKFDRQIAAIDRPVQRDAAERVARGKCVLHARVRIDAECVRDLAPGMTGQAFRQRPHQFEEFI